MQNEKRFLVELIRSQICSVQLEFDKRDFFDDEFQQKLYDFAELQDMGQYVSDALYNNGFHCNPEIMDKFFKLQMAAMYNCENYKYTLAQVSDALSAEKIEHIPLKGSVLREFYPQDWFRTSCDIDVLVHEEDFDRAFEILKNKLDVRAVGVKSTHDIGFITKDNMHVELHYRLDERTNEEEPILLKVWEYAKPKENSYCYKMTNEFFCLYHILHMAKHVLNGGCGIRPFVDLWIIKNKMGYDLKVLNELLALAGRGKFFEQALALSEVWLDNAQHTAITKEFEEYIFAAGIYGNIKNYVELSQAKRGGKAAHAVSKIWLPFNVALTQYPILENKKWLYPFVQIHRWFRIVFRGHARDSLIQLKYNSTSSNERVESLKELIDGLGF